MERSEGTFFPSVSTHHCSITFKVILLHFFSDPFALKRNVARSLNSQMVFEYVQERFRTAYKYFACPQSKDRDTGGRQRGKKTCKHGDMKPEEGDGEEVAEKSGGGEHNGKEGNSLSSETGQKEEGESDEEDGAERALNAGLMDLVLSEGDSSTDGTGAEPGTTLEHSSASPSPQNGLLDSEEEEAKHVSEKQGHIAPEDLHYIFDRMIFTGGKVPVQNAFLIVLNWITKILDLL